MTAMNGSANQFELDIWGTRGSRNLVPPRSAIGNNTSCYSLLLGKDLVVMDGGRGLAALGFALSSEKRFASVERINLFVGHAHMDHWEGLKDCDWFWSKTNGLELTIHAPQQALDVIQRGYGHPSFVPLEILAEGNLADIRFESNQSGEDTQFGDFRLDTFSLYHYSGSGDHKRFLDTLGIRISVTDGGPVLCYLCDHEPTEKTHEMEGEVLSGASIALVDAHFPSIANHAYGHGSQEYAAKLAHAFPETVIIATHHGPSFSDEVIRESFAKYSRDLPNLRIATEGTTYRWNFDKKVFEEESKT
jgi:phosphoribosyl 1,2-cyclic phosphodiesterase